MICDAHVQYPSGMTSDRANHSPIQINRRLLASGAALMAIGGVVGFAGMALGGAAIFTALRQWVRQMDHSPTEIAVQKLHQAKEASLAGAHAWRAAASHEPS
jgi:hypothetical protein